MKVFGQRKRAAAAIAAAGALLALAACTPAGTGSPAASPASTPDASAQSSTTAPPSPSAEPGTSATVGALVEMAIDAALFSRLREVALVGILLPTAVGAVALALGEQAARVTELAIPEHLEEALALLAFLPHHPGW